MAAERDNPDQEHDEVIEAGIESFPASDPPSFNMPARHRFVPKQPAAPSIVEWAERQRAEADAQHMAATDAHRPGTEKPPRERDSRRLTVWVAAVSAALLLLALLLFR